VRGHRDQIGAEGIHLQENLVRGVAEPDDRLHGHAFQFGLRRLQELESVRLTPLWTERDRIWILPESLEPSRRSQAWR